MGNRIIPGPEGATGVTDHGVLTGLGDDDHAHYLLASGARAVAGVMAFTAGLALGGNTLSDSLIAADGISVADTKLVTAGYLNAHYATSAEVVTDHGVLTGLGDDDHAQYLPIDGTRAMTGQLQISGAGIEANVDADESFIFGRARIDSRTPGRAIFSHFDRAGVNDFALSAGPVGQGTILNSPSGAGGGLSFSIGNTVQWSMSLVHITSSNGGGPRILEGAPSATVPVFIPAQNSPTAGLGGVSGTLSLITGGTEALLVDASQKLTARSGMDVTGGPLVMGGGVTVQAQAGTAGFPGYAFNGVINSGMFRTGSTVGISQSGTERQRWTSNTAGIPISTILRDAVGVSDAGEMAGLALANTTAAALGAQQFSPMFVFEGQGFNNGVPNTSREVLMAAQLETVQGDEPTGELVIKGNINGTGYVDAARLTSDGHWLMPDGALAAPAYSFAGTTNAGWLWYLGSILAATVAGSARLFINASGVSIPGTGSEGAPIFKPAGSDSDSGFWQPGANILALSTGGTEAVRFDASQNTTFSGHAYAADGTATDVSFGADNNGTGMFFDGVGDTVKFSSNGTYMLAISAGGAGADLILQFNGTEGIPAISNTSINTGVWWPSDDDFAISVNGSESARWNVLGRMTAANGLALNQGGAASGTPAGILVATGAAFTSLTNAEAVDVMFDLSRSVQFDGAGSFATQRAFQILAPTYTGQVSTLTITDAATFYVSGAPTAGANAAITNPWAVWVDAGTTRLDGDLDHRGANLGLYAANPVPQGDVTGSTAGNAALQDLLTKLSATGIVTDSTT